MTDLRITYRDWLCDGDGYLRDLLGLRGWWNVRADTDNWVTPDGRLFIDGDEVTERPGEVR